MENTSRFSVTKDQVVSCKDTMKAIAVVIASANADNEAASTWREVAGEELASEAMSLYHGLGRVDVDESSEMIGCDMCAEVERAIDDGMRGYVLFERLVDIVVQLVDHRCL